MIRSKNQRRHIVIGTINRSLAYYQKELDTVGRNIAAEKMFKDKGYSVRIENMEATATNLANYVSYLTAQLTAIEHNMSSVGGGVK